MKIATGTKLIFKTTEFYYSLCQCAASACKCSPCTLHASALPAVITWTVLIWLIIWAPAQIPTRSDFFVKIWKLLEDFQLGPELFSGTAAKTKWKKITDHANAMQNTRILNAVGTMDYIIILIDSQFLTTYNSNLWKKVYFEGEVYKQKLYSVLKIFIKC